MTALQDLVFRTSCRSPSQARNILDNAGSGSSVLHELNVFERFINLFPLILLFRRAFRMMASQPRASFHILRIVVLKAEKALLQSVTDKFSTADGHIYLLAFVSKRALEDVPGSPSSEDPIDWFERAGHCLKLWCFRHPNIIGEVRELLEVGLSPRNRCDPAMDNWTEPPMHRAGIPTPTVNSPTYPQRFRGQSTYL